MGGARAAHRSARIARVLGKHLVLRRMSSREPFGSRLRDACEELGTSFIKLGQVLSTRYDIMAVEDCAHLRRLLDEVEPFSYEMVREIVSHDLGAPPERIFRRFDPVPIASASVSQVHAAWLKDGRKVAVKVRRPYIGKEIEDDMQVLHALASVAQMMSPTMRYLDAARIVEEIRAWLMQEIDFRIEARNLIEAHERAGAYIGAPLGKGLGRLFFPRVYPGLCSYNVLTMEFLEGVPLSKYDPRIHGDEYDPYLSVKTCANATMRQIIEGDACFFNGDPHPANFIIMPRGDVGIVDFGLVGRLEGSVLRHARDLFLAVYARDADAVLRSGFAMCGARQEDFAKALPSMREEIRAYLSRAHEERMGYWFMALIKVFIRHRLPVPYDIALFGRMNIVVDGLVHMVDPSKTTIDVLGDELRRGLRNATIKNLLEADYAPMLYAFSRRLKESPHAMQAALDGLFADPDAFARAVREMLAEARR